ncbi:uncharacterized protein [Anabrus simplex]|uniref:uncharacterized protein n=1 Tax=Anabrus simplex TaxID=316456 RepID=UPI0035A3AC43
MSPNVIPASNTTKETKKVDVNNLLTKHYGDHWRDNEELLFYKNIDGADDTEEEEPVCEPTEESWLRQNGVSPPENATKDELQRLCNMNRSHLKRYVVDEMLHSEGHTVLRLPPYNSFFNAIEFVWSVAKQYYNKTVASRPGHGLDRATAVWKESLDQVTAEMWRNEVKHTEKKIVEFYNNEVRGLPEVEELVIHHGSSESEEEDEEDEEEEEEERREAEELAVPL